MARSAAAGPGSSRDRTVAFSLLMALTVVFAGVIHTAPADWMHHNEDRVAAYVWDAVENGNWICQKDAHGGVMSKPPLYVWIAALASLAAGEIAPWTLYFPSAIATVGVVVLLFFVGERRFGPGTGFAAGFMFLLSHVASKQMCTARTDGLFSLMIALTAFAAFHAWNSGRGWIWFWLAASAATLTKGPLGLLLGAAGLLAVIWERKAGHGGAVPGRIWPGFFLFLGLTGGWFLAAYVAIGQPLIDKMIGSELMRHATGSGEMGIPGRELLNPAFNLLTDFAPWSILFCMRVWRVVRGGEANQSDEARRFERFLVCWVAFGLLLFGLASHQRSRLIYPLVPAVAMLAGREGLWLIRAWSRERVTRWAVSAAAMYLMVTLVYQHGIRRTDERVVDTAGLRGLALEFEARAGEQFPLTMVSAPFAFQYPLESVRHMTPLDDAVQLLRSGSPAYVVVKDLEGLAKELGGRPNVIARWPEEGELIVAIVSNQAELSVADEVAFQVEEVQVRGRALRVLHADGDDFELLATGPGGVVTFTNRSERALTVQVRIREGGGVKEIEELLDGGEIWTVQLPTG